MAFLGKRHKLKKSGHVSLRKLKRHPSLGCRQHLSKADRDAQIKEEQMERHRKREERKNEIRN